jgi:nickel-dependent lactate racemase
MDARPMKLTGNPVAENLARMLALVKIPQLFSIQLVTGRRQKTLVCYCGDLVSSFNRATVAAREVYSRRIDRRFDLVIAEMRPPLDQNLYQMQKGIENCAAVVRDGGIIVVVSLCPDGIGNDEFHKLAQRLKTPEAVLDAAQQPNPPLGIHKLSRILELSRRISVRALTSLEPTILKQVFIEPARSLGETVQEVRGREQRSLDVLLVRDAGMFTVL